LRHRALALSTSIPHAGGWLKVIPSSALGVHFHDYGYCFCLQYWVGLNIHSDFHNGHICLRPSDPFGDHDVGGTIAMIPSGMLYSLPHNPPPSQRCFQLYSICGSPSSPSVRA
jgi:hypothetical protein